jgi:predicted dehydrogenase
MKTGKVRVGIIGIGFWALTQHVPNLRKTGKAKVVAISRRNPKALADAAEALDVKNTYTDWHELLEHPRLDAVVVSTPHYAHVEPTLSALERGLYVLVEKPVALTSSDAWEMVEAAEQDDRTLMVGYNSRCLGCWRTVRKMLKGGAIGPIRQICVTFYNNWRWMWEADRMPSPMQGMLRASKVPESFVDSGMEGFWRRDPAQMGGGMFTGLGTHMIDLALGLAGAPPAEIVAFNESAGLPVDCFMSAQARLTNGTLLTLNSAAGVAGAGNRLAILGDGGVVTADWRNGFKPESIWIMRGKEREQIESERRDTVPAAAFVKTVRGKGPNLAPPRDGAYAVALVEAAYRSLKEGRIIQVALPQG